MSNQLHYRSKTFSVGDTIQVWQKVIEGDKERLQLFEGVLIAVSGREQNQSFTVRKIASAAIGVERIWPVHSPTVVKIKRVKAGQARRAKLYYLRSRTGKLATKVKEADKITNTSVPSVTSASPVEFPNANPAQPESKSKILYGVPSVIKKPIRKAHKPTKPVHAIKTPRATSRKTSPKTAPQ